jgi:hypothetical protein
MGDEEKERESLRREWEDIFEWLSQIAIEDR